MDNPPVNALTVAGWFELADTRRGLGDDRDVRVRRSCGPRAGASTPASTSRRCRHTEGFDALIGANRGCFAAFAAVYECAVPVIAAVHGFCLGGGIGLVGNADIIVASRRRDFGLPEVDRGALGAATHLSRLVPQHKMRADGVHGGDRHRAGAAPLRLGARGRAAATSSATPRSTVAAQIAEKSPTVIRAAKESLNGIDLVGREAQSTASSRASRSSSTCRASPTSSATRSSTSATTDTSSSSERMTDKRMTEDDVVAELRDGMTIGIGGWGSRRKPMSLVRAICRVRPHATSRS